MLTERCILKPSREPIQGKHDNRILPLIKVEGVPATYISANKAAISRTHMGEASYRIFPLIKAEGTHFVLHKHYRLIVFHWTIFSFSSPKNALLLTWALIHSPVWTSDSHNYFIYNQDVPHHSQRNYHRPFKEVCDSSLGMHSLFGKEKRTGAGPSALNFLCYSFFALPSQLRTASWPCSK